jgi:hypothetical protein
VDPLREDDETLLEALLSGARREDDAEVQAVLLARPELRERLERIRHLAADLDSGATADAELLREALRRPSPLDGAARELALRSLLRPRRFRGPLTIAVAVAAAIVAVLTVWLAMPRSRPAGEDDTLGHQTVADLAPRELRPSGAVADYTLFRWNLPLPREGSYVLRFRDGGPDGRVLLQLSLETNRWSPTPAQRSQLTKRMSWDVRAYDRAGTERDAIDPVDVWLAH